MALVSNNSINEVFSERSSRAVMDSFWKSLSERMAIMGGDQCLQLLQQARTELVAEEAVDVVIGAEIAELLASLSAARFSDDVKSIHARLVALATKHFKARLSVSAVFEISVICREQLLATALALATASLKLEGYTVPAARYALLSFGDLGRKEIRMNVNGSGSLILIFEDSPAGVGEYFNRIALRLEAILIECSLSAAAKSNGGVKLWCGSVSRWLKELESGFAGVGERGRASFAQTFEMVADCRYICGDNALSELALDKSVLLLQGILNSESFRLYAKSVANMPLALGIFGRLKTPRTGMHRGEFSLEDIAITPLIAAVRILAVHEGKTETSTAARIWLLLKYGIFSVNLADRLLTSFQNFIRHQIELEINPEGGGKRFFNPDALGDEAKARFKDELEDLGTLQRRVYQQIIEVD